MTRRIDIEPERERLRIEFSYDEDLVKRVKTLPDRSFDPETKDWYVPFRHLEETLELLLDHHFKLTPDLREYCRQHARPVEELTSDEDDQEVYLPVPPETFSITDLNLRAQAALEEAFDDGVWLVGELQGFDRSQSYRHTYFELVERPAEGADPNARISAIIFEQNWPAIRTTIAESRSDLELRDGLSVRVRGEVDLYPPKGNYQFLVRDIDPAYTTGRLQQRRRAILQHLDSEGIRERNRQKSWPTCPLRVGLITSWESDAYNDFRDELEQSGYGFEVTVVDTYMQGERAEPSMLAALEYFESQADDYDVLAVVRGGGARSDLAYFDTEAIGEAVCRHPVKIVCGIGHERDVSLLDHIAASQKTPTAAARCLVRRVENFRDRVDDAFVDLMEGSLDRVRSARERLRRRSVQVQHRTERRVNREASKLSKLRSQIAHGVRDRLESATRRVDDGIRTLKNAEKAYLERRRQPLQWAERQLDPDRMRRQLERYRRDLERLGESLVRRARDYIRNRRRELEQKEERLELLDPECVLERGFVLLRHDGTFVRSVDDVEVGDVLEARLADGRIDVTVRACTRTSELESEPPTSETD